MSLRQHPLSSFLLKVLSAKVKALPSGEALLLFRELYCAVGRPEIGFEAAGGAHRDNLFCRFTERRGAVYPSKRLNSLRICLRPGADCSGVFTRSPVELRTGGDRKGRKQQKSPTVFTLDFCIQMEPVSGFEPETYALRVRRSTS